MSEKKVKRQKAIESIVCGEVGSIVYRTIYIDLYIYIAFPVRMRFTYMNVLFS